MTKPDMKFTSVQLDHFTTILAGYLNIEFTDDAEHSKLFSELLMEMAKSLTTSQSEKFWSNV